MTLMQPKPQQNAKYSDSHGYDAEGYGVSTGIHKNLGVRRYYRPRVDTPLTVEEEAITENVNAADAAKTARITACFNRTPTTEERPWGGHRLSVISHDESRCRDCGGYFSEPDM